MQTKIHKTAIIGKWSIIEDPVEIGARTQIGNHVLIKKGTRIGKNNLICSGELIGIDPQDYHFKGENSHCCIGDNNIIREYATISRATGKNKKTVIGNDNFIMTYVHIAHNAIVGSNVTIASGSQIGGYVEIGDHVNIGGLAGIHQFCRIGDHAMVGAKSYLNKDLPPFFLGRGNRAKTYGVNTRGLRRHNYTWKDIEEIKLIFRLIYFSPLTMKNIVAAIKKKYQSRCANMIADFIRSSHRGIIALK